MSWPGPGGTLRWSVNVREGGRFRLRMRAISPDGAERRLRINEQTSVLLQFPQTAFRSWADSRWVEYAVDLKPGRNTMVWSVAPGESPARNTIAALVKIDVVELQRDTPGVGPFR